MNFKGPIEARFLYKAAMLKAGVFVDTENVNRCGGWSMRYDVLKAFVTAQSARVVRANAYMAIDREREDTDGVYARKKATFRSKLRGMGFKLSLKPVRRYRNEEGETVTKANSDLDFAIDALLQARRLDYVVLVSGDGDFARLCVALQDAGCRVDVIGFHNVSRELREVADNFCSGFLIPDLVPILEEDRRRGYLHTVNEERYFGFMTLQNGLGPGENENNIFLHGNDLEGSYSNEEFARLVGNHNPIEFSIIADPDGRRRAVKAKRVTPEP